MQYMYMDGEGYHFMDQQSFEEMSVPEDVVGDQKDWLLENMNVQVSVFSGRPVSVSVPNFVELAVAQTDPGLKGDTVSGARKQATLTTGATINVPLFVNIGDKLKIDTRTGEYVERVK
jgi:elongation factor P